MKTIDKILDYLRRRHARATRQASKAIARFGAKIAIRAGVVMGFTPTVRYDVVCRGPDGAIKWRDGFFNLVVNVGLDDLLDKYFKGSGYTAAHYVGLTDGTPTTAATDTMSSHAGWTEVTDYDEAARQTLTLGSVSGQSVDNSASTADFTISANSTTIGGAFVSTDNTKGGTSGTLYGVGAFTGGDKAADDDDTLSVTITLTTAAS